MKISREHTYHGPWRTGTWQREENLEPPSRKTQGRMARTVNKKINARMQRAAPRCILSKP